LLALHSELLTCLSRLVVWSLLLVQQVRQEQSSVLSQWQGWLQQVVQQSRSDLPSWFGCCRVEAVVLLFEAYWQADC